MLGRSVSACLCLRIQHGIAGAAVSKGTQPQIAAALPSLLWQRWSVQPDFEI